MTTYADAVRRAARAVHVPGTPRSLRLDRVEEARRTVRLAWSFVDPEQPARRISDVTAFAPSGDAERSAHSWWEQIQLTAALRYRAKIDADWVVGEPYVRKIWTVDEAWQALLDHLGARGHEVRVEGSEITVLQTGEAVVYRIDPDEWAAYLTDPEPSGLPEDAESALAIVPAAMPLVDGLPIGAADELMEAVGTSTVAGLVDGQIVGLDEDPEPDLPSRGGRWLAYPPQPR